MKSAEKPKLFELLAGLSEIYDKSLSETVLDIYWNALKDYSLEDVKKAVNNIVQTHKYATFPKPAEFIAFICPPQDAEDQAELMIPEFWERFDDSGYHSFEWKNPILAMAIEHYGGWRIILDTYPRTDEKEAMFWLKDFKKTIRLFIVHPRKTINLKFVGFFEEDNRTKGYLTDKTGSPVALPGAHGFIMLNSPEAKKYLEDHSGDQKLLSQPNRDVIKSG